MAIKWNCLESLTALGIGAGALALAPLDAGLTAGAVIGGAGLFARIKENARKAGLDDDKLIGRVQTRLLKQLDHWDQRAEREAAERADEAMTRLLPQVMLSREELAATAFEYKDKADQYPAVAARQVVDKLAQHDTMFAEPSAAEPDSLERQFALDAITAALLAAKDDPEYATLLTLELAIGLAAAEAENREWRARVEDKVDAGFARQDAGFARQEDKFEELKAMVGQQLGVPIEVIGREIAAILEIKPAATQADLYEDLKSFKDKHDRLKARVSRIETFDNRIASIKAEAREALDAYDHEKAATFYAKARALIDERNAQGAKQAAEFAQAEAESLIIERDWEEAAAVWADAARKLAPFDAKAAGDLGNTAGIALYEFGEKYGGGAMNASIAACRAALEVRTRDQMPVQWAMTQNNLGNALQRQGERLSGEAGAGLLGEAVNAYRAVLEVHTSDQMPVQWAGTQNNLGNALQTQGGRLSGEAGAKLLGEAVEAYRAALNVRTRDQMPVEWATTQNNLGAALQTQGAWLSGEAGAGLLGEAVTAYRAALEVYTSDQMPVDWAVTQNNLGIALQRQGERLSGEAGAGLLGEAVTAYRAALEVHTRDQMPVQWATTQNNLGLALQTQGARLSGEAGAKLLGEAVLAYRAALEVYTSDQMPVQWAMTQENMAGAFLSLATVDALHRCDHLVAARAAVQAALTVYTPDAMPYDYGTATRLLTKIDAQIDEHGCDGCAAAPQS